MADTRLSSSISSLRQKLLDQIPSANPEQLKRIARSARNLGHTQDTDIEDAINTRANTLIVTANATESEAIAAAINQVDDSINPNITVSGTTATAAGTNIVTSDAAPGNPEDGDLWFKTDEMNLYIYYDDGTSSQWIQSNAPTVSGGSGDISDLTDNTGLLGSGGATVYADMAALIAATGMSNGDLALVTANNNIYVYNGSGWYKIATVQNDSPSAITGVNGTYELAMDGTATTITAVSTDPDGFPLTWSYAVTSGSLGTTATVSQTDNVFTITPSTTESDAGEFELTFSATDGVNGAVNSSSSFTLAFSSPYDLSVATSNTVGTTYYQHNKLSNTIHFSPDGTKMYENNAGNYQIYYAELSTAWDLSTAVRDESKTLSVGWNSQDIYLKPDGTVLYTLEVGGGVFEWHMSTAWDLDTAVAQTGVNDYLNMQTALGSGNQPSNIQFINGGSRLYVKATHTNVFLGFNLTTPWDITTATYASALDFTSGVFGGGMDMGPWKSDGTKFIAHDADTQTMRIYTCSTAWDASTASSTETLNFNNAPHSFTSGSYQGTRNQPELSVDESKIYIFDKDLMGIRTFNFGTNWDLSTLTETPVAAAPNTLPGIYAASPNFSTDGTRFLYAGQSGKRIYQVDCSTPYDLSTSGSTTGQIYTREWSDGSNLETGLQFCTFKPDGTYVYFGGSGSSGITSIGLPTAWDLTSISTDSQDRLYVGSANFFGVGSNGGAGSAVYREDDPKSMVFKPDGTKFYVCGTQADKIHEFNCSIPWRVTNADVTYEHSFDPSTPLESGMDFSSDGTKMFVGARASQGKTIIEYTLSTPWNISTAVFVANHNPGQIGNMGMDLRDFNFNTDGTKLYAPQSGGASSVNYLFEFDMS